MKTVTPPSKTWLSLLQIPFEWFKRLLSSRAVNTKQLRVAEITQLGEKRLLALVEVGSERYLVGASGTSVSLLTVLSPSPFAAAVKRSTNRDQRP